MRPVNASVAAKQASKMLLLVWSRGLLFKAIITSTLSRTVNGQAMLLMMIVMISLAFSGTFAVSPSVLGILVAFVKLTPEKLAMWS